MSLTNSMSSSELKHKISPPAFGCLGVAAAGQAHQRKLHNVKSDLAQIGDTASA